MANWSGDLRIRPGLLVFAGSPGSAAAHQHAAHQLVLMHTGTVTLTGSDGVPVEAAAALIPSGERHAVAAEAGAVGLVAFADATTTLGRALRHAFADDEPTADPATWVAAAGQVAGFAVRRELDPHDVADLALSTLAGDVAPQQRPSPSLERAVSMLPGLLTGPVRLSSLAGEVGMSADGLGRLFRTTFGMTFPTYVRWARLRRAAEAVLGGATITEAAHAAGFADGAHANRVCWEMFGISPLEATRELGTS